MERLGLYRKGSVVTTGRFPAFPSFSCNNEMLFPTGNRANDNLRNIKASAPFTREMGTYGVNSIVTIGVPVQYSTVRESPLRLVVVSALVAPAYS
jgi:hypothetical protein